MGVCITANNSKYSFEMGAGGFFNLRKNIALAFDPEFGAHYSSLLHCHTQSEHEEFDRKTNAILSDPRFREEDADILDFLFASDCDGKVRYRTCGKIYRLIKDIDFGNKRFQYVTFSNGRDYEEFKDFLHECYSHRWNMYWY